MYRKILKNMLAAILITIGILGIFLPIIPGLVLIFAGLLILKIKPKDVKKWLRKIRFS